MIYEYKKIKDFLKHELEQRIEHNPRYSLRSFAKSLGLHPAELSMVLRGDRTLSYKSSQKVATNLGLSPSQQKYFIEILQFEKNGIDIQEDPVRDVKKLNPEKFQKISKWYHFAILNLMNTPHFKWTPQYISKRLGVSQIEAGFAMQDLLAEGLVTPQISKKKSKSQDMEVVQVQTELPSSVIRNYHAQILQKAQMALQEVPKDLREYQSIGISCSLKDLEKIKKELDDFTSAFIEKFHKNTGDEVYQLQLCFFPLTTLLKEKQS